MGGANTPGALHTPQNVGGLLREPFTSTRLEEERATDRGKTEGVWLSNPEREVLERIAVFFHQPKLSTTIKHCIAVTDAILEGRDPARVIRDAVFNNVRKNRRIGLEEIDPRFRIS